MDFVDTQVVRSSVMLFSGVEDPLDIIIPPDEGAVIDLIHVVSLFQVEVAIRKALLNMKNNCMKSKNIQSEICYYLTPLKNINDSVRKLSPSAKTTAIAVILVKPSSDTMARLNQIRGIQEDACLFERLMTPEKASGLVEFFKVTAEEVEISGLEDAILMKIAVKEHV